MGNTYAKGFFPIRNICRATGCRIGRYLQWRAKVFGHPLKSHNFFKINPNDLRFFEKLEGLVC